MHGSVGKRRVGISRWKKAEDGQYAYSVGYAQQVSRPGSQRGRLCDCFGEHVPLWMEYADEREERTSSRYGWIEERRFGKVEVGMMRECRLKVERATTN